MTSLTTLIAHYRAGIADYNKNAPTGDVEAENAYADVSYVPPMQAILHFDCAAISCDEAHLALDLAEEELAKGEDALAAPLIRAARLYLREVTPC